MRKLVIALAIAFLASAANLTADVPKSQGLLMRFTSQQEMDWEVHVTAHGFHFTGAPMSGIDLGETNKVTIAKDRSAFDFEGVTHWSTEAVVVAIEPGKTGGIDVEISDPYVKDRHTTATFSLDDIRHGREISIKSKDTPIRDCSLRLSMNRAEVEQEAGLIKKLGSDRKKNIDTLLVSADKAGSKTRRNELMLRAAAACTGGCNHGPLKPNGWDRAIAIYQQVIDENKGTDIALDALWAQAECHACWSPVADCDWEGRGKSDYPKEAFKLYEKIYQVSALPTDKADALRRMAEDQCFMAGDWDAGLKNYRRIALENPGSLPPSQHWTYRTCAPYSGTDHLAWDIHRALVYNASDNRNVQQMFNDYFGDVKDNPHIDELAKLVRSHESN